MNGWMDVEGMKRMFKDTSWICRGSTHSRHVQRNRQRREMGEGHRHRHTERGRERETERQRGKREREKGREREGRCEGVSHTCTAA
jgi:hypothetical protein